MSFETPSNVFKQNLTVSNVMLEIGSRALVDLLGDDATSNELEGKTVNLELATEVLTQRIASYLK